MFLRKKNECQDLINEQMKFFDEKKEESKLYLEGLQNKLE